MKRIDPSIMAGSLIWIAGAVAVLTMLRSPIATFCMFVFGILCLLGLAGFVVIYVAIFVVTVIRNLCEFYNLNGGVK